MASAEGFSRVLGLKLQTDSQRRTDPWRPGQHAVDPDAALPAFLLGSNTEHLKATVWIFLFSHSLMSDQTLKLLKYFAL
jgi:hypothetical protein